MARGQTVILAGPPQRLLAHRLVDAAPDRARVIIQEETRSNQQNDRMWAMLSDLARARPDGRVLTTEKWKCLFLDALGEKANWEPSLDGDGVVNVGYRSSRLSKSKMSELIDFIEAWGTQKGVRWSV